MGKSIQNTVGEHMSQLTVIIGGGCITEILRRWYFVGRAKFSGRSYTTHDGDWKNDSKLSKLIICEASQFTVSVGGRRCFVETESKFRDFVERAEYSIRSSAMANKQFDSKLSTVVVRHTSQLTVVIVHNTSQLTVRVVDVTCARVLHEHLMWWPNSMCCRRTVCELGMKKQSTVLFFGNIRWGNYLGRDRRI